MKILYQELITVSDCKNNPEHVFVFGDNTLRKGKKGQAIIRDEPNAFGIPTKRFPSTTTGSYFNDNESEDLHIVTESLRDLWCISKNHVIVWPSSGIGTGLAQMKTRCPIIWMYMNDILLKHFGIVNGG